MIVCVCRAKTERDVLRAVDDGATSLRDLQRCGMGTDCGSCQGALRALLAEAAAVPMCPHCGQAEQAAAHA